MSLALAVISVWDVSNDTPKFSACDPEGPGLWSPPGLKNVLSSSSKILRELYPCKHYQVKMLAPLSSLIALLALVHFQIVVALEDEMEPLGNSTVKVVLV